MKISYKHWYSVTTIVCLFLLLIMVYRREARIRTHIESLEQRIEALELYAYNVNTNHNENENVNENENTNSNVNHKRTKERGAKRELASTPAVQKESSKEESPYEYEGKFKQVVKLELNTIDSATLVRIPGIGEGTAKAILIYREKLGGYYSTQQLREKLTWDSALPYLDEWCNEWFWVDENLIQKMHINSLSFKELVKHPYLDFNEVKSIVKWRDKYKAVKNEAELRQIGITDSTKMEKLLHYVEFDVPK